MITYDFYCDEYGGGAGEEEFDAAVGDAETVITALVYPVVESDMNEAQAAGFGRAVCLQVDYRIANKFGAARVKSESLGDHSVTYDLNASGGVSMMGVPVAPAAVATLQACGCLSTWI